MPIVDAAIRAMSIRTAPWGNRLVGALRRIRVGMRRDCAGIVPIPALGLAATGALRPGAAGPVVAPALQLVREVVDLEPGRVVVGVHVALAVAELAAVPAPVAKRLRRLRVPPLAHVGGGLLQRDVRGVRLR